MDYRYLGNSGLKVSSMCLGAMTFGPRKDGAPGQLDREASFALLDAFVAAGGNFVDTANVYSDGESERIVGEWLARETTNREAMVIATKVRFPTDLKDVNSVGLSRKHILASVQRSLTSLKTDYIDLLQTHCWDDGTPLEETLSTLKYLVDQGKVRYIGVSNVTGWQLQKIVDTAKAYQLQIVSLQAQYSLLCRETEWELQDVCAREGIALLPWSPLKGGWLSGKIKRGMDSAPEGSRVKWAQENSIKLQSAPTFSQFAGNEKVWQILDTLEAVAKETGKTVAQVALRWLLQQKAVSSVVIGAKTIEQLKDNLTAAAGWTLTPDQLNSISTVSSVPMPYPYEMVFRSQANRLRS